MAMDGDVDGSRFPDAGTAARGLRDSPYVDKDCPWSSHWRIREGLADLPAGTRLLDVGAATGTMGRVCAGRGFVLHGLEPNAQWAELARPYYDALLCSTLEQAPDAFLAGHDAVICADVLEHLVDPPGQLQRLIRLQPQSCRYLISVPNVANLWVRLQLLLGRFDYAERGILDRTHLHFYTRRTLRKMLSQVGLEIVRETATPIPLELVRPAFEGTAWGRMLYRSLAWCTRRLPTLLGYQFVVQGVPRAGDG